jgi:membrane protein YqaA with SNARE-associated domain
MLDALFEFCRYFVEEWGLWGLFLVSFTDSFVQPVPPDPFLLTLSIYGFNPYVAFLVTISSSLLGGMVGYYLGLHWGHRAMVKIFKEEKIKKTEEFIKKGEFWGIVVMGFTPIPYQIGTWLAGMFEMPMGKFLLASMIGRSARFILVIWFAGWLIATFPVIATFLHISQ